MARGSLGVTKELNRHGLSRSLGKRAMKEREKLSIIFWYCSRKEVAVKSQYPDIADLVDADLTVLERIFTALANIATGIQLQPVLDYLRGGFPMLRLLQRLRLPSVVALEIVIYQDKNTLSQKTCHAAKRFQRMGFLS
jgi:hypothetical protein